jgi:uncharacterized protein YbjQ (UPF0145 family)
MLVVTTNELQGYRIVRHLGLVRGLTVRSRSVVGNLAATLLFIPNLPSKRAKRRSTF